MSNSKENAEMAYKYVAMPLSLTMCLDNNCRSMLFTMIQLSSYYANEEGYFFRTNADLQAETNLSENLVRATISTLYEQGVLDVKTVGAAKGTIPNYFKIDFDAFKKWEQLSIEDAMKNPLNKIPTSNYKDKGWKPSYLNDVQEVEAKTDLVAIEELMETPIALPTFPQSEDNITNTSNEDNKKKDSESSENSFIVPVMTLWKQRENNICNAMTATKDWSEFRTLRQGLFELQEQYTGPHDKRRIDNRIAGIERGKMKYFAKVAANNPYSSEWEEVYEKTNCGYKGAGPCAVQQSTEDASTETKENVQETSEPIEESKEQSQPSEGTTECNIVKSESYSSEEVAHVSNYINQMQEENGRIDWEVFNPRERDIALMIVKDDDDLLPF